MALAAQAGDDTILASLYPLSMLHIEKDKGLTTWGLGVRLIYSNVAQGLTAHSNNNPGVLYRTPHSWRCLHQVTFPHSSLLGCINDSCQPGQHCHCAPISDEPVGSIANHTYPSSWKEATIISFIRRKLTWSQRERQRWPASTIIVTMPTAHVPRVNNTYIPYIVCDT